MNRAAGLLARALVLGSLGLVWIWPATASVLEATQAVASLQNYWIARGRPGFAAFLDDWPGSNSVLRAQGGEPPGPMGPAPFAPDPDGAARQFRLGLETLKLIGLTELFVLPLGVALAWFLFRSDVFGGGFLLSILVLALFVPLPLHATAWLGAFGNVGRLQALGPHPVLVGRFGAAVVHALAALPWVVLLVGVGLRRVEAELEDSARLDRPPWWVAIHIALRRGLGGVAAAALAVAVLTAGDMTVTDLLQIRTYAEEAYLQSILGADAGDASAAAAPPMLVLGLLIGLMIWRLIRAEPRRSASIHESPPRIRLGARRIAAGVAVWTVVVLFVGLPFYGLVWRAGRVGGRAGLGRPPSWSAAGLVGTLREALDDGWEPLETSLLWSAVAAVAAALIAWSSAWLCRDSWIWRLATLGTVVVGLATPGPVAGMVLKIAYRTSAAISDTPVILVLGLICRTLPYAVLIVWPAIRMIPSESMETAAIAGYGPWGRIQRVAIPFTRGAAVAACMVAFALALGELPATNLVLPPGVTTISMRIWSLLHTGVESHLAGVALIMLAVVGCAGLIVLAAARSLRRFPTDRATFDPIVGSTR